MDWVWKNGRQIEWLQWSKCLGITTHTFGPKKEEEYQTWKDLVKYTINGSKRACFEFLEPTDYGV